MGRSCYYQVCRTGCAENSLRVQCISSERGVSGLKSVFAVGGVVVAALAATAALVYLASKEPEEIPTDAEDWLMGMFNDNGYGDLDA